MQTCTYTSGLILFAASFASVCKLSFKSTLWPHKHSPPHKHWQRPFNISFLMYFPQHLLMQYCQPACYCEFTHFFMLSLHVCYEVLTPKEIWMCLLMHFPDLKSNGSHKWLLLLFYFLFFFFSQNSSPPRILKNSCNKRSELEVPHWFSWETEVIEVSYRNTVHWSTPGIGWQQVPCCQGN